MNEASKMKRELFTRLLKKEGLDAARGIPRRDAADLYELSFAQQRLWFLDQFAPGSPVYNIPAVFRLAGRLDVQALERSLNEIVKRHAILRTSFAMAGSKPAQVVLPTLTIEMPLVDLSAFDSAEREAETLRLMSEESLHAFDLTRGALLRVRLLRLDTQEHVMLLTMHHIIADGWSVSVLLRELTALYEADSTNKPAPLPELPLQYTDFAHWERERLQGEFLEMRLAYWKRQLAAAPPALPLPTDFPRPAMQTFRGARREFNLSPELSESLKSLGRQEGCTLFMTLLAAFQTLLYRYTAQEEITVGTSITNRSRVETEPLIGIFVNTLVLRTDLSGNPSFRELLRRVREVTLEAYAHQDLPFEKLVEELQPERELSHSPLFQVMFVLQNAPAATLKLPGLSVSLIDRHNQTAKFDLLLSMVEDASHLTGSLEYSTDLFEAGTIERLLDNFQILLETAVAETDRTLGTLRILTSAEQHRLLVEWNDTATGYPSESLAHEYFERQAANTPDAVAVTFGAEQLTYRELNARANRLAHALRRLGVGADVLVGLLVERSLEMVIGLLGILKAGGAYLPLDPSYPPERLAFMLEDSAVPVLLTQQHLREHLPAHQAEVLCLDSEWPDRIAPESTENPATLSVGEHLSYTIYTSGSTGRPKGVQLTQRALSNLLTGMRKLLGLTKQDVWLAVTSLSFDIATLELCLPLIVGARIVLVGRETAADGAALSACLRECGASIMQATPSSWRMLVEAGWTGSGRLKILCGGEALKRELSDALLARCAGGDVWNGYGPTETTIYSLLSVVEDEGRITIGRPLANTQVYVLDSHMQPVPVGVAGELYIGGDGLARGYLKRPELTAERFIPDPFSSERGARMYRTGDLVRYLRDGAIEYLGRNDFQVKVRGYRIELGEIESVLAQHPAVLQGVVMARESEAGDIRLAAYLVANTGQPWPGQAELHSFLHERLPAFMIPSAFMLMDALPLTPNAKVDRKALPAPIWGQTESAAAAHIAPRNPFEEVLAGIWSQVLGVERVGVDDNFFEAGGHSLLATSFVSRVREVFQIELPLRRLFETPTLAGIAESIQAIKQDGRGFETAALEASARDGELPLSFSQQRLWFLEQLTPGTSAYNIAGALRLRGLLDVAALEQSLNEIIRRHEILRTTFVTIDGRPAQTIASSLKLTLPLTSLEHLTEAEQEAEGRRLMTEETRHSFDLTHGPLLRASLLRFNEQEHVLCLNMHHIVGDGWSVGILMRELTTLYGAFVGGERTPLPALPIQYADFAIWQRQWLEGQVIESQLTYWKRQLAGALPVLELPTARPRPPVQTFAGGRELLLLSEDLTDALKALSRREGVTVFITLLAVFKILLHRLTGQNDIIVGSPIAGRNRAETEHLIGIFINTLVLRTDLSGNPGFRELLGRVRETALGAYTNQDVPFEHLLEALQPERNLSHTPLFQVFFNMLNFEENVVELSGLTTELLPASEVESKFDLTLYVEEQERRLKFDFVYNASLFSRERVAGMSEQLRQLLAAAAERPEESIDAFSLITPAAEKLLPHPSQQLRPTWNGAVHTQFTEHACRTPQQQAVVDQHETYNYQELDARSNRLARYLLAQGVKPQDVVVIYGHRSAPLVLALLGIVKAGAAFVVLDPAYPPARLLSYLQKTKPKGWIQVAAAGAPDDTLQAYAATLSFNLRLCRRAEEADGQDSLATYSIDESGVAVGPEDMAYVAFTSGSTGKPKGIVGKHGSLAHFAPWARRMFGIGEADRFSMLSGLSHDPLHRDVFGALQLGATICIPDPEDMGIPGRLAGWMNKQQITVSNLTPAMGQVISQAVSETRSFELPALRQVFFVGDVLTRRDVSKLRKLAPATAIVNLYGATETSRAVGYYIVSRDNDAAREAEKPDHVYPAKEILPLGRGISEVQLLVLNAAGRQAGIGEVGEIYFRSSHIAKGYWEDEQLTRERFITNPFTNDTDDLLYRTGDLGRYLPDGDVEPLGRADWQVKIRGFRVELGEIEALLGQHEAVRESAVITHEDITGEKLLVAYIVPDGSTSPGVSELRRYLKDKLPDYMVPGLFVMLEELPLTPNRKLDRRALPTPTRTRTDSQSGLHETRTAVEEILAETWAAILGVEDVGLDENFFELGGHSLMAIQVLARVAERLRVELPLRTLFESPTVGALAEAVESARQTAPSSNSLPLIAQSRDGELPLSFAQQRLWFLDQFQPGPGVYNIPAAVRLKGLLNPDALEQSLNEIISRHEALRTTFVTVDGRPAQRIAAALKIKVSLTNLDALAEDAQATEVERLSLRESRQAFDLMRGPLLRARLLRLSVDEHILVVTIHHIVSDAWSLGVLVRELTALYEAFAEGRHAALDALPVQYADFALWQRERLQGETLAAQLGYWKEKLGGQLPVLELPTDRPRPLVQSFRGARAAFALSPELTEELNLLCRREGVTLFMLLLAAFQTLLYRYTGETDILVGTPTAGRNRTETEHLIGFFVNTLVMRGQLAGALSFKDLLSQTRESALDAYAHEDLPLEKLVEELRLERDLSREALFQVMFVLQNAPATMLELKRLSVSLLPIHNHTSKFDLLLSMNEDGGALKGSLEYSTDLFDESTIERTLGHFETLLQSIAADTAQQLDGLSLLAADEEQHLLFELNATSVDYPLDNLIHQQFEAQAARTPDAVALVFEAEQLSYRELNRRVNQLAHFLRGLGVGPEVLVGVMMERSLEMVVSLLGILKAGGAYVPLEPGYPDDRLAYLARDARMSVVLTQARLSEKLKMSAARVISVDKEWPTIELHSAENPLSVVTGSNLAYVIYTSGSTGQPKGAMNTHRAICNRLLWMQDAYELNGSDRVLQKTPFSFDVSVWEFFWPLMTGAGLIVAVAGGHQDSSYLVKLIAEQQITTIHFVPSMLQAFLEEPQLETCVSLKRVICSGEALPYEQQERLLSRLRTSLSNLYGPTEAAIDVTFWECRRESVQRIVPIGRPIANTQIYILNERQQPVPVGVAGELHIGGISLARGYLNRAGLTAEKFIPDSFSAEAGARLYKTGDSARYLADGSIEYLNRLDNQVKIRGYRIELGEIEAVLRQDNRVRDCLVLAREDMAGEKRLAAYVVAQQSTLPKIEQLRSRLKEKLPAYMIPAHFILLDALPLTMSGKVDRRALPAPSPGQPPTEGNTAAPSNQIEEILADIWASVLGMERVGTGDDFFDLGGHSLLAAKLLYRIQEAFGVELPLRRIFEAPTPAAAARMIEEATRTEGATPLPPIGHAERDAELPLSFAQQRLWILDQLAPDIYNEHSAIRLKGALNLPALEQSLNEIIRRHEILRTTFVTIDGRPAQAIASSLTLTLPSIDLRHLTRTEAEAQVLLLAAEEPRRSFDLTQGPLLRVALLCLGEAEHVVLLSLHHIVFDGWSNAILIQEAATLYEAFSKGEPSPLPELPIQYADFAVWQRRWLRDDILETHLAYWKQQLEGAPVSLQLPRDRPQPPTATFRGASLPLRFPSALADGLKVLSRQEGVTLFMTLLTTFKILLYSYSGQSDIVVGTNVANRNRSETEKLIGFFINLLVLRTDLSGVPSFREVLSRVREVTLKALAHQDLPFEKLVGELKLDRGSNHTPLVQAVIQLHTAPRTALELPGLNQEFLDVDIETVPFELVLNLRETDDGLVGALLYNTDLFDAATMTRMIGRFQLLLDKVAAEPDIKLNEIVEMLTEAERRQHRARREEFKHARRTKLKNVKLQPIIASS
jgi:amino acid adenylation domain-containing protein